ncbi:unnamed protein product [Echinostoma caproni]|uniref:DOP1 N-terminal domain-containing protein n=1 Tax=Echinostoma caproni TaxID=27848 RepID=A0A3P8D672_9TREM|nr:unnamed protein product [Echinostoma caproni]
MFNFQYVNSLGVIQSNAKANHIPRSFLVGKRLAQCLHPALPPGVHCKALECYDTIFRTIGPTKLATDLSIYGSGLFTVLGPSAMTVKPPLFDVFEEHLLSLGNALHPAFSGLLLVRFVPSCLCLTGLIGVARVIKRMLDSFVPVFQFCSSTLWNDRIT